MSTEYNGGHTWTKLPISEIPATMRLNPSFFEDRYLQNEHTLRAMGAVPLGQFIPDLLPDGSKGITYGQVGARNLDPRGKVKYLQVINIRETGLDFAIKPDRIVEKSHNDPSRSRVNERDILLTNTAFRGTDTLIGRCVVVHRDYGKINISQDIDRLRVAGINPYYVGTFLKTPLGQLQMLRRINGVDSQKINFGQIKKLLVPNVPSFVQDEIERHYATMAELHDTAMALKERLLNDSGIAPGQFGAEINAIANEKPAYRNAMAEAKARLEHLLREVVAVIERRQKKIRPFTR